MQYQLTYKYTCTPLLHNKAACTLIKGFVHIPLFAKAVQAMDAHSKFKM